GQAADWLGRPSWWSVAGRPEPNPAVPGHATGRVAAWDRTDRFATERQTGRETRLAWPAARDAPIAIHLHPARQPLYHGLTMRPARLRRGPGWSARETGDG